MDHTVQRDLPHQHHVLQAHLPVSNVRKISQFSRKFYAYMTISTLILTKYFYILEKGSCDQCTGGYYCLQNTSDPNSFPCPVGHYCPPGTQYDTQYKCSSGSYNPLPTQSSSTACKLCDAGTYCFGDGLSAPTGNCSQGWFCTGGASESKPLVLGKFLPL